MKKFLILTITLLFLLVERVNAKDLFFSVNKYTEEEFNYVLSSYNEDNKIDGIVTIGTVLKDSEEKDDNTYKDYQILLVKYNKDGKKKWSFEYGKTIDDKLYGISYTYDENNNINGYLILMNNTYNIEDEISNKPLLLRIDLNGELLEEKVLEVDNNIKINKVREVFIEDNTFNGYIIVGTKTINDKEVGYTLRLDKELNIVVQKDYNDDNYKKIEIKDIISNNTDGISKSFIEIVLLEDNDLNTTYKLINIDNDLNTIKVIKEDFDDIDSPKLGSNYNGFTLYGYTDEVKLSSDKDVSYYLINYNSDCIVEWDLFGNNSINKDKSIILYPLIKKDGYEYLLMYTNGSDSSQEVIRISSDGVKKEKIKKINNSYYDYYDFMYNKEVLYLVGRINCPEEDDCGYETNTLLLISSKDKVIEVTEKDSGNALLVSIIIVLLIVGIVFIRNKYKVKST